MNCKRLRLHIWHAYSTNDALLNDTKVNELVTLTFTFVLKITFSDSVAAGGIVFHKHTLIFGFISWWNIPIPVFWNSFKGTTRRVTSAHMWNSCHPVLSTMGESIDLASASTLFSSNDSLSPPPGTSMTAPSSMKVSLRSEEMPKLILLYKDLIVKCVDAYQLLPSLFDVLTQGMWLINICSSFFLWSWWIWCNWMLGSVQICCKGGGLT